MERLQRGSGIDYMNRSLDILREASRDSLQPLTILSPSLGNAARVLAGQENYAAFPAAPSTASLTRPMPCRLLTTGK